jgi:glycosyl transferase family 25
MNKIQVFVINLKKDADKKEHMKELCKQNSLDCQFIDAVYGEDLTRTEFDRLTDTEASFKEIGRELTKGEMGCALSHIEIYNRMINQNIKEAIILEDDITIKRNFQEVINMINVFPKDWEIMLLGYNSEIKEDEKILTSYWSRKIINNKFASVRLINLAYGTYGYIINNKGAQKLLQSLTKIIMPIDHYTGVDTYVNMYAINPRIVELDERFKEKSTIAQDRTNNKVDQKSSMAKILLQKVGLLHIAHNIKIVFDRFKKLKNYQ